MGDYDIAFPPGYGGATPDHNHAHEAITGIAADQHHAQNHASRHALGGADAVTALYGVLGTFYRTGLYYGSVGSASASSASAGSLRVSPLFVGKSITVDRIGGEVTTGGSAGAVIRLGIWADDATGGYPGALVLDAGTIDSTSTGFKEITISQALTPGLYWIGGAPQAASCTYRSLSGSQPGVGGETGVLYTANSSVGYQQSSVSGALGTFTATVGMTAFAPRIVLRVA